MIAQLSMMEFQPLVSKTLHQEGIFPGARGHTRLPPPGWNLAFSLSFQGCFIYLFVFELHMAVLRGYYALGCLYAQESLLVSFGGSTG